MNVAPIGSLVDEAHRRARRKCHTRHLCEFRCDLNRGVTRADYNDALALEWGRIAVAQCVRDRTTKTVLAGQFGDVGTVERASRSDDAARVIELAIVALHCKELSVARDRGDSYAADDRQLEMVGILPQVCDHLVASRIALGVAREGQTRQGREPRG
jgi:hypothetical protein